VASNGSKRVGATALSTPHFLLLYAAMLASAAGNTALQSVMPAIGREIGIADVWVAAAYTSSAALWVLFAPYWAARSDRHGRKPLILVGLYGFVGSSLLCGLALLAGLNGLFGGAATFVAFAVFRTVYGMFGSATPSATQAYLASKTRRSGRVSALSALASSFGLGTILGPAIAPLFVLPWIGLAGPLFGFGVLGIVITAAVWLWLPDDRVGRRGGHGAAMSYPSMASPPTGASVIAATHRRLPALKWHDPRIKPWIIAGVTAGHAQAGTLTAIGFYVIDRLGYLPHGSEEPTAIVMMAGASATLAVQWGVIPRIRTSARALLLWGSLISAAGLIAIILSRDLYGLTVAFAVASAGFGMTRPGFTAGASLAVPLAEQGAVAGVVTAANGISFVAAPTIGMALYAIDPRIPYGVAAIICLALAGAVWRGLPDRRP
jgi:MFS family permease